MRGQSRIFRPKAVRHKADCRIRRIRKKAGKTPCQCPRVVVRVWWVDYTVGGQRFREPSGATNRSTAQQLLRERMGNRETGKVIGRPDRVTLTDLRAQLEQRYAIKGNSSLP